MKVYLIADTHFNHDKIATYCDRPADFTEVIERNWRDTVGDDDLVIHLGDVLIGDRRSAKEILGGLPGRKALVRGNHDKKYSVTWWMRNGFDFACDRMEFRGCLLTHRPASSLREGLQLNIHGHLHNVWHGFASDEDYKGPRGALVNIWQRLFALEYTDYRPVEFGKFIHHPGKYQTMGPKQEWRKYCDD